MTRVSVAVAPQDRVRETLLLAGRRKVVRALTYRSGVGIDALVNTSLLGNGERTLSVVTRRRSGAKAILRRNVLVANVGAVAAPTTPDRPGLTANQAAPRYRFAVPPGLAAGAAAPIRFIGVPGNRADRVDILLDGELLGRTFFRPGALGTLTTYINGARLTPGTHLIRAKVRENGAIVKFRRVFTVATAVTPPPSTGPGRPGGTTTTPGRPGGTTTTPGRTTTVPSPSFVPASSPLPGTFLWAGDYETGNVLQYRDKAGRTDADGQTQAEAPDRIRVVRAPVAQGSYAARFEVRVGDLSANGNRAEMWHGASNEREGDERWYQWYTLFDPSFPKSSFWQIFTQWHASAPGTQPPVKFSVANDVMTFATVGGGGEVRHWSAPMTRNAWHHFRLHVRWSASRTTGFVELYYNGNLVVPRTPATTMISGIPSNYVKQGLYRSKKVTGTSVIYHDGLQMSAVR